MQNTLVFILVVLPFLAGLACYLFRAGIIRNTVVLLSGAMLAVASVCLSLLPSFDIVPVALFKLIPINGLITLADFLLLGVILYVGMKSRHVLIIALSLVQLVVLAVFELFFLDHASSLASFHHDALSSIMIMVVSIIGAIICVFAIPYMKEHELHLEKEIPKSAGLPRFFAILVLFLGAMNGLVLTGNILHFYFFFEVTTLCSFLLIGQDKTKQATANALTALWMNSIAGVALLVAVVWFHSSLDTLNIQAIITRAPVAGGMLVPLGLLCLAGFAKSAQLPFQKWLTGAMVAPTPVSALLHSSTMVKAGVYLVLRFAPSFAGSFLSDCVAVFGGFVFIAAAALAVGQSNGKKVLAYSTISNLGLIFACAGINTPEAAIIGMLLIVFHAISKGLLFLCVGTVEQHIHSRDIEDMRGLFSIMPVTSCIMVLGVMSMILPPFGMLLGKWLAIEAAAHNLPLLLLLAVGSALTVLYWARWAGLLLGVSAPANTTYAREQAPLLIKFSLGVLCAGALLFCLWAPGLFAKLSIPVLRTYNTVLHPTGVTTEAGMAMGYALAQADVTYWVFPMFIVSLIGLFLGFVVLRRVKHSGRYVLPYMNGLTTPTPGEFIGPMNKTVRVDASNYYLSRLFSERTLSPWLNVGAIVLIIFLLGGAI